MIHQANVANDTERQIKAARELLKPTPVELGHVPNWLRRAILKAYGSRSGCTDGWSMLRHVTGQHGDWLDHYGSTKIGDALCFVSEPYNIRTGTVEHLDRVCDRIGCRWYLSANSWWFPGSTIRIVIRQKD